MKASTIKIENPLLNSLYRIKPHHMSLSAFVREVLEQNVRRRLLAKAAEQYTDFLKENEGEVAWFREWEQADLANPPKKKNNS